MQRFLVMACVLSLAAGFGPRAAHGEAGVTKNQIAIGMSTALTGPASFLGTSFRTGVEAYLNAINAAGGVNGRKIRLIAYDDGYEPNNTVVNAAKLIRQDGVFCLLGNVGTPTTVAIKQMLADEKVPLFAPFTGAEALRAPVQRYILHYRASYNQEVDTFVYGMVDVLKHKKVAVFYQDDAYGTAVLNAATAALQRRGLKPVALGTYTRNLEDVSKALDALMAARPDAVVMAGTYSACAKFITSWKRQNLISGAKGGKDPIFMNVSFVGPDRLASLLDKYGENVVVTQVVPPFYTYFGGARYPAVAEYDAAMKKYFPKTDLSFVSLEGYLATKVFVEILMRAGQNLSREGFIRTAEEIRDLDIQAGNKISFSNQNHQGSQTVYPTVIRKGAFYLIEDWNTLRQ